MLYKRSSGLNAIIISNHQRNVRSIRSNCFSREIVAYGDTIFVTIGDKAHILKTRIIVYITFFPERQSIPGVIKTTIQGTKARDNYI